MELLLQCKQRRVVEESKRFLPTKKSTEHGEKRERALQSGNRMTMWNVGTWKWKCSLLALPDALAFGWQQNSHK